MEESSSGSRSFLFFGSGSAEAIADGEEKDERNGVGTLQKALAA
jgi:hypothetical protein